MAKPYVDLNTPGNHVIVIAKAHVAFVRERGPKTSEIGFTTGEIETVTGTVAELVAKIWPAEA